MKDQINEKIKKAPSIIGYINERLLELSELKYAQGLSKFKLMRRYIFRAIPNSIKPILGSKMIETLSKLSNVNGIVKVDECKYFIRDIRDYFYITPNYEKGVSKILKVKKGDVFVDVGAHIGSYTIRAAKLAKKIVAVEAHPDNFSILKRNIELNNFSNVIALNIGAWSSKDKLKLNISEASGSHSFINAFGLGSIEIDTYPLDEVLINFGIRKVDWIKIDVEGAEFEVLNGLKETLKQKPKLIIELWNSNRDKVLSLLSSYGYKISEIPEQRGDDFSYIFCS